MYRLNELQGLPEMAVLACLYKIITIKYIKMTFVRTLDENMIQ